MPRRISTFSIAGRCARTGQLGVAVSTADVGAGRLVASARPGVGAVAMQSWPNPYGAIDALDRLSCGDDANHALAAALAGDADAELRQIGIVDARGGAASWTGHDCTQWAGHITGDGFAAQGNMLLGGETVAAMAGTFVARSGTDLAERLLAALEVGQAAGGDKRGRQCSALYVVDREAYALWDLRVDEHPEPVAELRRIYEIALDELLPFVTGLPTRENPAGSLSDDFVRMNLLPVSERQAHHQKRRSSRGHDPRSAG
jgi:uncharacterized Ntn-hydrolase superfamily protein